MSIDWLKLNYLAMSKKQQLAESKTLTLDEQKAISINNVLALANDAAHAGASKDEVHSFMLNHGVDSISVAHGWYHSANGHSVKLLNDYIGKHHVTDYTGSHQFLINDKPVHSHLFRDDLGAFIHHTHQNTQDDIKSFGKLGDKIKLYRGVSLQHNAYESRPFESWTSQPETAIDFATTHVLKAEFKPEDIVWHYKFGSEHNLFIPDERDLRGKEEHAVFGHRAMNLQIIPKSEFRG